MLRRLPVWVELWAAGLAMIAGMANAAILVGHAHEAVAHASGPTTQAAMAIASGELGRALHLLIGVGAFLAGAVLAGILIDASRLRLGRRYPACLAIEAALFVLAGEMLAHGTIEGIYPAAMACGLQNALATSYSSTAIRTTHITGAVTDVGLWIGRRLRGAPVDRRAMLLLSGIIGGFIAGGVLGALLHTAIGHRALHACAGGCALFAIAHLLAPSRPPSG